MPFSLLLLGEKKNRRRNWVAVFLFSKQIHFCIYWKERMCGMRHLASNQLVCRWWSFRPGERSRADCFSALVRCRVLWQRAVVLSEDDLSLKGQTGSEVASSLRKISSVCKKLYKYLPLLFFPTEIILQMLWKIIWTTYSYLNFTSFRILHFLYWWNDMRLFISAKSWSS